jgi:hypothetical protein
MADEAAGWNDLHARYEMERIDHSSVYSQPGGIYTNGAEEFFPGCAGPRSGITTTSPGRIWFATRRSQCFARIIAGRPMARWRAWWRRVLDMQSDHLFIEAPRTREIGDIEHDMRAAHDAECRLGDDLRDGHGGTILRWLCDRYIHPVAAPVKARGRASGRLASAV